MVENILDSMAIQRELALVKIRVTGDFCLPDKLIQQYQLLVVDRGLESLVLEATGIPTRHRQADQVAGSLGVWPAGRPPRRTSRHSEIDREPEPGFSASPESAS
jgi:acetolactate synthase small subunit